MASDVPRTQDDRTSGAQTSAHPHATRTRARATRTCHAQQLPLARARDNARQQSEAAQASSEASFTVRIAPRPGRSPKRNAKGNLFMQDELTLEP
eukprot:8597077-Pyramimonas_sp.AAC.1